MTRPEVLPRPVGTEVQRAEVRAWVSARTEPSDWPNSVRGAPVARSISVTARG